MFPHCADDLFCLYPGRGLEKFAYRLSQWHFLSITGGECSVEVEGRAPQKQVDCTTDTQDEQPSALAFVMPPIRF